VNGRREGVVGALRLVHMVVGMHRVLGADPPAQELDGPIPDHLVGVHVALGTGSRLPDGQREVALVVELPRDHIVGRIRYRRTQLGVQSEFLVGLGGRLLQNAHGLDYLALISVNRSGVIWA